MAKSRGIGVMVGGGGPMSERAWQAEQDMKTLIAAHKIRADKPRHQAAKAHAKRQLAAMQDVATGGKHGA